MIDGREAGGAAAPASRWAEYHRRQDEALNALGPYPAERFGGRGIVMVVSGPRYFTSAWVCLTFLRRKVGCGLPIQLWHLGPDDLSSEQRDLLRRFGVELVDALEVRRQHPVRTLWPWQCKPYSILHSRFREVILLDADLVPLIDPAVLFETPEYRQAGAIFWPDVNNLAPD